MSATPVARFPVAVMMTRKVISGSGWSRPSWQAVGVLSGSQFADGGRSRTLVRDVDGVQHFLFRGYFVDLFRDAVETYWWNLTGTRPSLFVICDREEGDELAPSMVTPDHEAAQAAAERDAEAFAVAIPPEIHAELERVVMEHYRPEPPRKRKQHKLLKEEDQ